MVKVYNRKPRLRERPPEPPPPPVMVEIKVKRDRSHWIVNGERVDLTKPLSGDWIKLDTPIEAYEAITITLTRPKYIDPEAICILYTDLIY